MNIKKLYSDTVTIEETIDIIEELVRGSFDKKKNISIIEKLLLDDKLCIETREELLAAVVDYESPVTASMRKAAEKYSTNKEHSGLRFYAIELLEQS